MVIEAVLGSPLDEKTIPSHPFAMFTLWYMEAVRKNLPEIETMTLATATKEGKPSARIVLLKGFDEKSFLFYTDYRSRKGKELTANPHGCLLFYWHSLDQQVRIEGTISKLSFEKSKEYFRSRPFESQIAALASEQSSVIPSREDLQEKILALKAKYESGNAPMAMFWGGYLLNPDYFEFWQKGCHRLHDRVRYKKLPDGEGWKIDLLSP